VPIEGRQPSFERSLSLVDLLQVHDVAEDRPGLSRPCLNSGNGASKIRYLGISTSDTDEHVQLVRCMHKDSLYFVQINYSLAHRDAVNDRSVVWSC
jgi:diketogulonate reductase-like aldo/keto reductase